MNEGWKLGLTKKMRMEICMMSQTRRTILREDKKDAINFIYAASDIFSISNTRIIHIFLFSCIFCCIRVRLIFYIFKLLCITLYILYLYIYI